MSADKLTIPRMLAAAVMLVGVCFLALGVVKLANLWVLIFGSVVVAVIVRAIADPLVDRFGYKDGLAVLTVIATILAVLVGIGFLFGQLISEQVHQLLLKLPGAWAQLQGRLAASPAAGQLMTQLQNLGSEAGRALALAPRIALGVDSGLATLVLVLVAGVFLAAQPSRAREGVLAVAPKASRSRLREVMNACRRALKGWVKAQVLVGHW